MPVITKVAGSFVAFLADDVKIKQDGAIVSPEQGFVKTDTGWHPLWAAQTEEPGPDPEPENPSASPLPPGVPRWGVAQFSDTDFTGGKSNPNMDGKPYDRWEGPQDFIDNELQTYDPSMQVAISVPFPDYGYFAHKASDGTASFMDSVNGWPGGWDGAQWSDGGFGTTSGPITVTYDDGTGPADWVIYRTDFSGIGDLAWTVTIA